MAAATDPLGYTPQIRLRDEYPEGESWKYEPDRRDGCVYVYQPELKLVAEIALVTGRPLLLQGEPGSGKSSFAAYVARNLDWRYYEFIVNVRSLAMDLQWRFDTVRRLNDAHRGEAEVLGDYKLADCKYVEPGPLWWVFDRLLARRRGRKDVDPDNPPPGFDVAEEPYAKMNSSRKGHGAVLLIDEIDKADPDFPNELLVPLGSGYFKVKETGTVVKRPEKTDNDTLRSPLVVITTNRERALPEAFVRRCIVHELDPPTEDRLVSIASCHFTRPGREPSKKEANIHLGLAKKIMELRKAITDSSVKKPSSAEYLDTVAAYRDLEVEMGSKAWEVLEQVAITKGRTSGK